MKVYLTDEENAYLYNMVKAAAAFYEPHVRIFKLLTELTSKTQPPRSFISVNTGEQTNINSLLTQALGVIEKQKSDATLTEKEGGALHLAKVEALLSSIKGKLNLAVEPGAIKI